MVKTLLKIGVVSMLLFVGVALFGQKSASAAWTRYYSQNAAIETRAYVFACKTPTGWFGPYELNKVDFAIFRADGTVLRTSARVSYPNGQSAATAGISTWNNNTQANSLSNVLAFDRGVQTSLDVSVRTSNNALYLYNFVSPTDPIFSTLATTAYCNMAS